MKRALWLLAGLCLIGAAGALDPGLGLMVLIVVVAIGLNESGLIAAVTARLQGGHTDPSGDTKRAHQEPDEPRVDTTGFGAIFLGIGRTKVVCLFPIQDPSLFTHALPKEVDRVIVFEGPGHAMPRDRVVELYGDDIVRARVMGTQTLPGMTLEPDHDRGEVVVKWGGNRTLLGVDLCFDRIPDRTQIAIGTMKRGAVPDPDVIVHLKTVVLVDYDGEARFDAQFWSHMGVQAIVVGTVPEGPVHPDPEQDAHAQEQALIALLLSGEDEAFERIVDDRPAAQFQLGVLRCVQLRYDEALACFERAAEGGMVEAWASVASMRRQQGDRAGALAAAERAVAEMPGDPISATVLSRMQSDAEMPSVQRFSAHARQALELAAIHVDEGTHDMALRLLTRARQLDPREPGIYAEHGALLARLGRERDAEDLYRQGIDRTEAGEMLRFNLGNSLLRQGRYDEAIAEYDRCLEILPDWAGPLQNREAARLARG